MTDQNATTERTPGATEHTPGTTERTLGQLVADATHDLSSIIHSEIALAKAEIGADAKKAGIGAGLFAAAGLFAFLALILLPISAAYGLVAAGLAPWLAFLIVSVLFLLIGVVLALVGKGRVSKIKGKPERAIKNAQDTIAAIRPTST